MRFNNFNYRNVLGDEKYNSSLVTSLINKVMRHGKKEKAKRHVYESLKIIESELKKDPIEVLSQAIKNLSPSLENKSRKRGGVTLQIPFETSERRKQSLSLYWIVKFSKELVSKKTMARRLAAEIINVYNSTGKSIETMNNIKGIAEKNKAYAILKW